MSEHPLDDYIRKKLEDYSAPVPGDMWQRIQQKKEKKRRFLFFWRTLFVALLLGGMATGYYFLQPGQQGTKQQQASVNNQKQQDESAIAQQGVRPGHSTPVDDKGAATGNRKMDTGVNGDPVTRGNTFAPPVAIGKKMKTPGQTGENTGSGADQLTGIVSIPVQVPGAASEVTAAAPGAEPIKPEAFAAETPVMKMPDTNHVKRAIQQQKDTTAISDDTAEETSLIKGIALEVYASPDLPINILNSGNAEVETKKKASESMQLSYSVGMRLNLKLNDRFSALIGLNYAQINQRFDYSKYEVRSVPVIINRSFTDEFGIQSVYTDTAMYLQAGTRTVTSFNTYRSLDLPLLMGYRIGKGKLQTTLTGGVVLNLTSRYNGTVLDGSLNPVNLDNNTVYNNNLGMSLYTGVNMSWKLKPGIQLFTEPYLRYRLGNMAKPSQGFTQKFHVGGLSVGLRYQF